MCCAVCGCGVGNYCKADIFIALRAVMHLSRRCALLLGEVKVWGYGLCELPIPCANGVNRHGTVGPFGSWELGIVTWHTYGSWSPTQSQSYRDSNRTRYSLRARPSAHGSQGIRRGERRTQNNTTSTSRPDACHVSARSTIDTHLRARPLRTNPPGSNV